MSYRKIFWGVLLVLIGILFILKNTGVLFFSWHTFWHLWPVLLILWGISIIPVKDWIKLVLSFLTIVVTFFAVQKYAPAENHHWNWEWNDDDNNKSEPSSTQMGNLMTSDFNPEIKSAKLNLNIGVGHFTINDSTASLIEVRHNNDNANYSMTTREEDSLTIVDLSLDKAEFKDSQVKNDVFIKLNSNPVWDLDLNVGAAEVDFDLSAYKTRNVRIQGGASDIDLKVGASLPESEVKVEAGAASIVLRIPESAGAEIVSNTFLASKEFNGFTKTASQHYETPNFAKSEHKIKINLQAGVASVEVIRY